MASPGDRDEGVGPDDAMLTAWLDGALPVDERARVAARLEAEPALKARMEFLRSGSRRFAPAYDALLDAAPAERLNAMLDGLLAGRAVAPSVSARRWPWRAIAAAIVIFAVGAVAGMVVPGIVNPPTYPGWRQAVAQYHSLITPDTLAVIEANPAGIATELAAIGDRFELDLSPGNIALPDAILKRTQLYDFDGRPLVQLVYDSSAVGPIALCIIDNDREDSPLDFEQREGSNIVYWYKGGRGYMLIARDASREQLEAYARDIEAHIS